MREDIKTGLFKSDQEARKHTGLGGAGGIDINLPWPEMPNGTKPEIF